MKLLLVSNMYPSESNPGYGVFVKNFEDGLISQGVDVDKAVISGRGSNRLDKVFKYFLFFIRVSFFLIFRRYDCVYVHYIAHSLLPLVTLLNFKRVPLICNAHGEDLLPRSGFENLIFRYIKKTVCRSRMIVVPSEFFAKIAKHSFPYNEIFVSPSAGVDLKIFNPRTNTPFSYGDVDLHLGFVSRVDEGKGWDILLYAAKSLRDTYPSIKFKVSMVGEGKEIPELYSLIEKLELQDCIAYVGALQQSKLPEFYSSIDAFIFPTELPESLGLVGIEAMACGVPAICSDIGGIRSYVEDGVNGYLFTPGDSGALAQRILEFSKLCPEDVMALKFAALSTAKRYDREQVSSDLYLKLTEVMKS